MLVRDQMSGPALTIEANLDYRAALGLMQEYGVRHLPVVNAIGELVGMVAERDLVNAGTRYLRCPVAVSELMRRDVLTVSGDSPVADAAVRMRDHNISALPVVASTGQLVGIVTTSDILTAWIEAALERASTIRADAMMS